MSTPSNEDRQRIFEIIIKAGDISATVVSFAALGMISTIIFPGVAIGVGSLVGATVGLGLCTTKFPRLWIKKTVSDETIDTSNNAIEIKKQMLLDEMSILEQSINNLYEVIVLCDRVQQPNGELLEAVARNLEREVRYTFLVSRDTYQQEVDLNYQFFLNIAKSFLDKYQIDQGEAEKLVRIKPLKTNWDNNPFIFYKTKTDELTEAAIIFQGDAPSKGICESYNLVDPTTAPSIYDLLISAIDWQGDMQGDISSLKNHEFITPQEFAKYYLART